MDAIGDTITGTGIMINSLTEVLNNAQSMPPENAVTSAITVYMIAQSTIERYEAVKESAKKLIQDVMTETGVAKYATPAGNAAVSAPSTSVSYDAKALDILLRDDADLAMRLAPYRKTTERAGSLRITAAK